MRRLVWTACAILLVPMPASSAHARQGAEGLPPDLLREVRAPDRLPWGRYTLAHAWSATGREAAHQIGRVVADKPAERGKAWEARVNRDSPVGGHLLYGPYIDLPEGNYVVFYRLKLMEEAGEERAAEIDAAAGYGQQILVVRDVLGSDLKIGSYVQVPLAFRHPGGKLECRMAWGGYASVRLDRMALYRLDGGTIPVTRDRVPQPTPSGLPTNLALHNEPRPFPDILPRSQPPASSLVVVDVTRQPPDWQLLLIGLQGLVNRSQPRIYCLFNPTDASWLNWIRRNRWVKSVQSIPQPRALVTRFRSSYKGMVITDPALPASKNVACMIASVDNGLVASPRIARDLKLPVLADLRGRWKTSVDAYKWAFDTLWPRMNHHVAACAYPDHTGLRDYLIENKVFTFWLSGQLDGARPYANPNAEVALVEKILARMPANVPILSYPWAGKDIGIGEGPGVTLFAEFGKYLVGTIDCANLSVHSGIRVPKLRQKDVPVPPLQNNKVYLSFVLSDGDNLPVLTNGNFPQLWRDPVRGKIPISWTLSPAASVVLGDVVSYYYQTATANDSFMAAVSGVGYTYPDSYGLRYRQPDRGRVFDGFLDQTATYMARTDEDAAWIMGITKPELIRRYAERIPNLTAIFPDYGRRVADYDSATYPTARNVPVFHAVTGWRENAPREEQIASLVADVRAITPKQRPAFMHFFVLNWYSDLPMLQEVLKRLGPEYVAVRNDHLARLYGRYLTGQQILVRVPDTCMALEDRPITIDGTLQNVSSRRMTVGAEVVAGLKDAVVEPASVDLAPGGEAPIAISGIPSGERVQLRAKGVFGMRDRFVSMRTVPAGEVGTDLPEGSALRFAGLFEAERMPHAAGHEVSDPTASDGKAWAIDASDPFRNYVVYGPYVPMSKGRYVALFRVKRTEGGEGDVLTVDSCPGGGRRITASRAVRAEELPVGEYRWVALTFDHPGGDIELRFLRMGSAALAMDCVALWEVVTK